MVDFFMKINFLREFENQAHFGKHFFSSVKKLVHITLESSAELVFVGAIGNLMATNPIFGTEVNVKLPTDWLGSGSLLIPSSCTFTSFLNWC